MARLITCIFSSLLLFTAVVFANEAESSQQTQVNSKSEHAATLRASPEIMSMRVNNSATRIVSSTATSKGSPEYVPSSLMTDEEKNEDEPVDGEEDDKDDGEGEEDVEGEEKEGEDEYEDELKIVAESHEAMSKDETRNSNLSAIEGRFAGQRSQTVQTFESQERNTEDISDEDDSSNEAITDEILGKEKDQEVAQLLKYKKGKIFGNQANNETKAKRVPTVKKELSTQKEILAGSNETEVPKSLVLVEKTYNGLNEETEPMRRKDLERNELSEMGKKGDSELYGEMGFDDRYLEPSNRSLNPRKLNKRQETALKEMLTEYTAQQEYRQKLEELGVRAGALAESLLKLLAKLAEDPSRWERVLRDVEEDLEFTKDEMDARKRNYEMEILRESVPTTPTTLADSTKKGRKKPAKNRKNKPRRQRTSPAPSTSPTTPRTTTETPWVTTTPVQWRLVAERLFGQSWSRGPQEDTANVAKVRYSIPSKPRTLSPSKLDGEDGKKNGLKTLNAERQALILGASREFPGQPRRVHFGKVNTHQSSHPPGHRELPAAYERDSGSDRMRDYDPPEPVYQPSRYDQFTPQSREFSRSRDPDDYQSAFGLQEASFAHNREYRPSGQQFAMTKSWPDQSFKYSLPWKPDDRSLSETKWSWRQNDMKLWPQRPKPWQIDRDYARQNNAMAGETEEDKLWAESEKLWNRQEQKHQSLPQRGWDLGASNTWPVEKSMNIPPPWPQTEQSAKYDRENTNVSWTKNRNRSELNKSSSNQENKSISKISMKTWNSLTSDPATWPFKLPGAKPWPKDKNGKSYNPNADLVRKLGLDKQSRMLAASNEPMKNEEYAQMDAPKYDVSEKMNHFDNGVSVKGQGGEVRKQSTPWSRMLTGNKDWGKEWNKPRNVESLPQSDDVNAWRGNYDSSARRPWGDKNPLSAVVPKIQSVGAWVMPADQSTWKPYEIKHVDGLNENFTGRRWPVGRTVPVERPWPSKGNVGTSWNPPLNAGNSWPPKLSEEDLWNSKVSGSWSPNINKNNGWNAKVNDNGAWNTKASNAAPWNGKSRDVSPWRAKLNEEGPWTKANGEENSWQQKISDEWNDGLAKGTVPSGSWPSKWKQFAYHRVTAMPMTKPGTTADASSKPRNAFVAVSAVSSPKYSGNSWRKNDIEETVVLARNENAKSDDPDHPSSQRHTALEPPIYAWKKDGSAGRTISTTKKNETDPLENQLESLREGKGRSYKDSRQEIQEESNHTSPSSAGSTVTTSTNSPFVVHGEGIPSDRSQRFESQQQGNSMN